MDLQQFGLAVVCLFIGALISYFITTMAQRNVITRLAKDILINHEKEHHKDSPAELIKEHEKGCIASQGYNALHTGIVFLVTKQGGDLKDLGLIQ